MQNTSYTGLILGDWPNPNVGWETVRKLNAGVDLSLFGKVKIQVDYFNEKRSGIFLQASSIPAIAGLATKPWINIGKMNNEGFDASLEYHQRVGEVDITAEATSPTPTTRLLTTTSPTGSTST